MSQTAQDNQVLLSQIIDKLIQLPITKWSLNTKESCNYFCLSLEKHQYRLYVSGGSLARFEVLQMNPTSGEWDRNSISEIPDRLRAYVNEMFNDLYERNDKQANLLLSSADEALSKII